MAAEMERVGAGNRGLAAWLLKRFRPGGVRRARRLELVDRIALAPRQSVALIEAGGRRFLVASSAEGTPAFYPLDAAPAAGRLSRGRVSW
jgi:flagellar biogenesis protein FliO